MSLHQKFPAQTVRTLRSINDALRSVIEANAKAIDAIEKQDEAKAEEYIRETTTLLNRASSILNVLKD